MRIVCLSPWPDGPELRLNPRITVILGLLPYERVELVSTAHSLALGENPVWAGTAELDGREVSLTEAVGILGRVADSAPVITSSDLPAPLSSAAPGPADEADIDTSESVRCRLAELAEELEEAEKLRIEMNARVVSAQANIGLAELERIDRVDGELHRAARRSGRPDPWTGMSDVAGRSVRLLQRLADIERRLTKLPRGDRVALAEASASLRLTIDEGDVSLPDALRIRESWCVLDELRREKESEFRSTGFDRDASRARLESARAAMRAAEDAATPREITPSEAARIEEIHDLYAMLGERTPGRMRQGSVAKKAEETLVELTAVLEEIGYSTWSQFRMGNGMAKVAAPAQRAYEAARDELNAAEIEWAELKSYFGSDKAFDAVNSDLDKVHDEAVQLIGTDPMTSAEINFGDRLMAALAEVKTDASTHEDPNALPWLRDVLSDCGLSGQNEVDSARGVLALGESWLTVLRDVDSLRLRLLHDRSVLSAELRALESLGTGSRVDRLDAQRQAVQDAEGSAAVVLDAMADLVQARVELHVLAQTELMVAEEHDAKADLLLHLDRSIRSADARAETASRGAEQVSWLDELLPAGSGRLLPLMVMMGGDDPSPLDSLISLSDEIQVIVVADGESMQGWAGSLGPERASVIDRQLLV